MCVLSPLALKCCGGSHIYTTPSSGEGWLDRVSSTVFIALGLGGRSVSFGDRNASLGELRFEGNCYPEML